ncbi:MAG: ZPR1 zinc finger domain-containing protein [Methanolinea sp.]|nr:ZPR1 zinc finger domain-containing protein [Methanolinea sp.]
MRQLVPGPCPSCGTQIEYIYQTEDIPYFSGILIISVCCPSCGFRMTDSQLLKNTEPSRWELSVDSADDMMVRVVRSMNGIITIPELGVRVDPGPACEGFVSNVEGVLARVEKVIDGVIGWAEDEEERCRALAIKNQIARVKNGELPVTLIIDDPTGNSAIFADKARITPLACEPEEEENGG